jgi:hypothetical protein
MFVFMCYANVTVLGNNDYAVDIDANREPMYELIHEGDHVNISYTDDELNHYLFIKSDANAMDARVEAKDGTIYVLSNDLKRDEINSKVVNDTAEVKLHRRTFGNEIKVEVSGNKYDLKLKPETELGNEPEGMSPWTGWMMTIIIGIVWLTSNAINKVRQKQYIEAYISKIDENGNETLSNELKVIGEYKGEFPNKERGCIDFEMRSGTKRSIIHSDLTFSDYKHDHCVKSYFIVRYLLDAHVWEERLKTKEEIKLGWSKLANLCRALLFLFGPSVFGVFLSPLAWAIIFSLMFYWFAPAVLIGVAFGEGIVIALYYVQNRGHLIPKRETAKVITRRYIAPLEAKEEMLNVYKVSGTRLEKGVKIDEAEESEWKWFEEEVTGYETLYRMEIDERVKLNHRNDGSIDVEVVGSKRVKKNPQEMRHSKRTWMRRNKQLYERMFGLRKRNAVLRKENSDLMKEQQYIYEELHGEMREMMQEMKQQRDARMNTLKKIMEDEFGSVKVEKDLDKSVERAMRIIRVEEQRSKANKMDELIHSVHALIDMVAKKADIKTERLKRLIEQQKIQEEVTK